MKLMGIISNYDDRIMFSKDEFVGGYIGIGFAQGKSVSIIENDKHVTIGYYKGDGIKVGAEVIIHTKKKIFEVINPDTDSDWWRIKNKYDGRTI